MADNWLWSDVYEIGLGESFQIINDNGIEFVITRVPGGWIFTHHRLDSGQMTDTFVPYDNSFKTT